jgi:hypothetical protein
MPGHDLAIYSYAFLCYKAKQEDLLNNFNPCSNVLSCSDCKTRGILKLLQKEMLKQKTN